jgi:hypothetical protein
MDLSYAEVGYFISQVADSAASFGVAKDDLTVVGNALTSLFDVRALRGSRRHRQGSRPRFAVHLHRLHLPLGFQRHVQRVPECH